MEINGVKKNCMPQTRLARKQQLHGTGYRAGCEVIPLCNTTGAAVQLKKSIEVIHARRGTEVIAAHVETAASTVGRRIKLGDIKITSDRVPRPFPFTSRSVPFERNYRQSAASICQFAFCGEMIQGGSDGDQPPPPEES